MVEAKDACVRPYVANVGPSILELYWGYMGIMDRKKETTGILGAIDKGQVEGNQKRRFKLRAWEGPCV